MSKVRMERDRDQYRKKPEVTSAGEANLVSISRNKDQEGFDPQRRWTAKGQRNVTGKRPRSTKRRRGRIGMNTIRLIGSEPGPYYRKKNELKKD